MLSEVVILWLISILFLLGSYTTGAMLDVLQCFPRPKKILSRVYSRVVFGILALVSLHAVVATEGQTIFSLSFVVFGVLFYNAKINKEISVESISVSAVLADGVWLLIPATMIPLAIILQLFYSSADHLEPDLLFYAKIAEFIDQSGENMFHGFQYANQDFSGMAPYHYFEMWFVNFFQSIFSFTSIVLLKYFTYPLFKSLIALGILSMVKKQEEPWIKQVLWSLLILGLTLLPIEPILNFTGTGWRGFGNMWLRPNLVFYIVFALPSFMLAMENRYREAILISFFIPLVSITTAPSYYVACVFVLLYFIWKKEKNDWWFVMLSVFLVSGLIFLLYKLFGTPFSIFELPSFSELLMEQLSIIKAIIGATFYLTIQVLLVSLVLWVLAYFLIKELRPIIVVCALLSFIGVILFQMFPLVDNTYQFPYFGYAMLNLLLIIIVSKIIVNRSWKVAVSTLMVSFVFICYNARFEFDFKAVSGSKSIADFTLKKMGYSEQSIAQLANFISDDERIAFTLDQHYLQTMFQGKRRHFLTMQLGAELSYKFQRLRFYPIVLPHVLYCCPENDPSYAKPRAFNESLEYYSNFVDDEFYTLNYLNQNNVSYILRNTEHRLNYDPYYKDQSFKMLSNEGIYIVRIK